MAQSQGNKRSKRKEAKKSPLTSGKQKRQRLDEARQAKLRSDAAQAQAQAAEVRAEAIRLGTVIIANLSKQAPNSSHPPTEYRDVDFTCVDCGSPEVWTARQQQWWYEVAKGSVYATAIRCRECRRQKRLSKFPQQRDS